MKKITLLSVFICCFTIPSNAQFFKKLGEKVTKAAERTVERKAEQKTQKETEKVFDSTFNKKRSSKTKIPRASKVDATEKYTFKYESEMYIKSGKDEMTVTYFLPNHNNYFGMSIKDERVEDDFFMVYDTALESMFTFMENQGQKMQIGVSFKVDEKESVVPEYDIKATGNSKTILGYNCKEYKVTGEDMVAYIWATKDVDARFPNTLPSGKKNKTSTNKWLNDVDGWAMEMEMTLTEKKKSHTVTMKCLSIKSSNFEINSNDYQKLGY